VVGGRRRSARGCVGKRATRAISFRGESHKGQTVHAPAVSTQIQQHHAKLCLTVVIEQQEILPTSRQFDLYFASHLSRLSTDGWMGGRVGDTMVSPPRSDATSYHCRRGAATLQPYRYCGRRGSET
jgi:hypothetical protein